MNTENIELKRKVLLFGSNFFIGPIVFLLFNMTPGFLSVLIYSDSERMFLGFAASVFILFYEWKRFISTYNARWMNLITLLVTPYVLGTLLLIFASLEIAFSLA